MKFPIKMGFKLWAFVPQIYVADVDNYDLMYVYQQYFRIKEKVDVYADKDKTKKLYQINADRIIDFSPLFVVINAETGETVCSVKRYGIKSLWQSNYEVYDGETVIYKILEANPWTRLGDNLIKEIPILGAFSGLFLNPSYDIVEVSSGKVVARITKKPSFIERFFHLEKVEEINEKQSQKIVLSALVLVLRERMRG